MKCLFCNAEETKVTDSRESSNLEIRRRRECEKCGKRFTTYETIEKNPLIVIKKDGKRENFSKEKIKNGLMKACEKRNIGLEQIENIANEIENALRNESSEEIPSRLIGDLIIKKLKNIDKVAYIRFASIYKDFEDVKDFEKEIKAIKK